MTYRYNRCFLATLSALILFSCAAPATPTPPNMAFVDIPKPEGTPQAATAQAISATTSMPTAQIIKVSLWVPPYFAETLDETLQRSVESIVCSGCNDS